MLSKIMKVMPSGLVVKLWTKLPLPRGLRQWLVWKGNAKFLVAVLGFIYNDQGQILLLKHSYRDQAWGVASGWIEHEDPGQGLKREVYEETGFDIKLLGVLKTEYVTKPNRINIFIEADYLSGDFKACEEILDYGFFSPGDWPEGMAQDQIPLIEEAYKMRRANEAH